MNMLDLQDSVRSSRYVEVRRRVFRQLLEALIYEEAAAADAVPLSSGAVRFTISGRDEAGQAVRYICEGRRKLSFGRIRLSPEPVRRIQGEQNREADDPARFLDEVYGAMAECPEQLGSFIREIMQTLLKDAMAPHGQKPHLPAEAEYEELEGEVSGGHPYHPCYKSRIGFDLSDHAAYGPEFKQRFKLLWIAIRKELAEVAVSGSVEYDTWIGEELGAETLRRFNGLLRAEGYAPEHYVYMPLHPWQWREKGAALLFRFIRSGQVVPLGEGEDDYTAQQSIRTLSNRTDKAKANVKLSLSIINTSALRIIRPHHTASAPQLSDWLASIVEDDPYLNEDLGLIVLKEIVGLSFRYDCLLPPIRKEAAGALGAIWRESIHTRLIGEEQAVPFTLLCHLDVNGRPAIDGWVRQYGLEEWVNDLLQVSIRPLIHLLFAHGIAMEAHAQNLLLIHRQGRPARLAIKDLPGGLQICSGSAHARSVSNGSGQSCADSGSHSGGSGLARLENGFLRSCLAEGMTQARDFFVDAFFHINFAELAMFLEAHYGFDETAFWRLAATVIHEYESSFNTAADDSLGQYDLFAEFIAVGRLATRRLHGEGAASDHFVPNPLFVFNKSKEGGAGNESGTVAM